MICRLPPGHCVWTSVGCQADLHLVVLLSDVTIWFLMVQNSSGSRKPRDETRFYTYSTFAANGSMWQLERKEKRKKKPRWRQTGPKTIWNNTLLARSQTGQKGRCSLERKGSDPDPTACSRWMQEVWGCTWGNCSGRSLMVRFLQRVNRQKRTEGKTKWRQDELQRPVRTITVYLSIFKGRAPYDTLNYFNHNLKRYSIFRPGHKNPENNEKGLYLLSLYIYYLHIRTFSLEIC